MNGLDDPYGTDQDVLASLSLDRVVPILTSAIGGEAASCVRSIARSSLDEARAVGSMREVIEAVADRCGADPAAYVRELRGNWDDDHRDWYKWRLWIPPLDKIVQPYGEYFVALPFDESTNHSITEIVGRHLDLDLWLTMSRDLDAADSAWDHRILGQSELGPAHSLCLTLERMACFSIMAELLNLLNGPQVEMFEAWARQQCQRMDVLGDDLSTRWWA